MGNYLDMVNRIADEAMRPDMTAQIRICIQDAIAFCQTERYVFNQFNDRAFDTVPGQEWYGAAELADIADALTIDIASIEIGGKRRRLKAAASDALEEWSAGSQSAGQPTHFALWGVQMRLYPTPSAIYRVRLSGVLKLPALSNDGDENAWTNEAEALIRGRASASLYSLYLRDDAAAARARALEVEAREMLAQWASRRQATSQIGPSL